jgi:hypothetical protein
MIPMATPTYQPPGQSRAQAPQELAERFERQLMEITRRSIALRRHLPGCVCRWRRAAPTGPNSELALVFILRPGQTPITEVWPYAIIDELAAAITDEEVLAELARRAGVNED